MARKVESKKLWSVKLRSEANTLLYLPTRWVTAKTYKGAVTGVKALTTHVRKQYKDTSIHPVGMEQHGFIDYEV